ncbi:MAG: diguanylate cyclase [Pseudomonadales bacterium]|nr:diguanylate cyclase [Pseudomonadales bacterium]NRA14190.1 diguanylate cyclase [Oceanospirillaceae bacterium]
MKFAEKPTQSAEYLRQAIPLMVKYKIPPNPLNYALWYTYVSKRAPKLNLELEKALDVYGTCPTLLSEEMFREHLIKDEINDADGFQTKAISLVNDLHKKAGIASQCAAEFQDVLTSSLTELRNEHSKVSREKIIKSLSDNTDSISKSNLAFQEQISAAQKEINILKHELKNSRNDPRVDPVTKLFNRGVFDREVDQLVQLSAGTVASIAIFELDNFQDFNEEYGQQMGDKIILFVANLLSNQCKAPSLAIRFAGTRFAMILLGSDIVQATEISESLRKKIESIRLRQKNSNSIKNVLSVSFGLSQMLDGDSSDQFTSRTLKALKTAKTTGKNKIVIA